MDGSIALNGRLERPLAPPTGDELSDVVVDWMDSSCSSCTLKYKFKLFELFNLFKLFWRCLEQAHTAGIGRTPAATLAKATSAVFLNSIRYLTLYIVIASDIAPSGKGLKRLLIRLKIRPLPTGG